MKKTRFVFIALYLIFQAISAFALDKNLVQKKLVEGHPDYYREDDILHDIGIIESKKLGKLYIYFNEHYWGNYRVTPRLIICDENKILGEYGILLMDKPWIKNNLLCFPYEEEIGNKIDFNNGIPKTVYVDGYLHNFTIYDINLNESKTVNLNVYHYAGNNLVKYVDPDGRANILSITPSDVELFLEETKQALSNIPTPAIVCVGIASGLIIANELSDGAVFEEIADGINFIADKTIEAGKWIGEKGKEFGTWLNGKAKSVWDNIFQSNKEKPEREKSPKNLPPDTRELDRVKLPKGVDHRKIKQGLGLGSKDWTGITPDGDIIVNDGEGNAEVAGNLEDFQ